MITTRMNRIRNKEMLAKDCRTLNSHMKNDEDVLSIHGRAQSDYLDYVEEFLNELPSYKLPENLSDNWVYSIELNENYCSLWLEHYSDTEYGWGVDESFELLKEDAPRLSVAEYAESHDYAENQVIEWLNRGKFRKAEMHKGKWRIPAYAEPCEGFEDGLYHYHEQLEDLPVNLQYLNKYFMVAILKDEDGNNMVLCMGGHTTENGYERIKEKIIISDEEREQLEAVLAADEDVYCSRSTLNVDYFERYI